ncbi:unnamed protein product [Medioppia subpectinata]|uniref:Uncharacterized protein n=1 Tax=Medioppia subpectinata TaxID=1979941 RepID=A0A7R9KII2_9ACAR|nr:unnamed protein product [Medioppia subpectinata]CAG2102801.1 unnamed protein product [Medioppia subpectinata]
MSVIYDFTGKVVLITGSSSGIGAATAVQFAQSGASVVVTGRRADKVAEVGEQCLKVSPKGIKALEVTADVTKREDMRRLVEQTIKHFGKLDILVNNAGAGIPTKPTDKDFYEKYEKVMAITLNSVVYLTYICVEYLEKTNGNIINISSNSGMRVCAVDMFTKCMAAELGTKRIRVNVINPGPTRTGCITAMGATQGESDKFFEAYAKVLPVGRYGLPEDIADSILYLASDHAAFVTGTSFPLRFPESLETLVVVEYEDRDGWRRYWTPFLDQYYLFVQPILKRVRSYGTVRLASADPFQPPLIDPRFLADPRDYPRDFYDITRYVLEFVGKSSFVPLFVTVIYLI